MVSLPVEQRKVTPLGPGAREAVKAGEGLKLEMSSGNVNDTMDGIVSTVLKQAGIAGVVCAGVSAVLNPFDVTKIRLQIQTGSGKYQGLVSGMRLILQEEGWRGLTKGIEPSIFRELSYSTVRIGAYEPLRGLISGGSHSTDTNPAVKFFSALVSGGTGAAIANPFDLVKTRMQACMPGEKLPYSNTSSALGLIFRTEGLTRGLYKGWVVTSTRAAILTSAQLGSYDTIKNNILVKHFGMGDGLALHLCSAMSAGIITTTAANPVDVIKTRYMSDGAGLYKNPLACIAHTYRVDGAMGFFKGWMPSYWRLGPHTVLSLMLIERIRTMLGMTTI